MPCCPAVDSTPPPVAPSYPPTGVRPAERKSALAFYALLVILLLPGILAQQLSSWAGLLWTELFGFLLPALVLARGSNLRTARYLKLHRVRPALILLGVTAGAAGTLLALALQATLQRLLPESWFSTFDLSRLFLGEDWKRYLLAVVTTFVAPFCEETAFRGYLLTTLCGRLTSRQALWATAVLFALVHLDPVRFLGLLALGALWSWLTLRAGSIWPAVAAHVANNALAAWDLLTTNTSSPAQSSPSFATVVASSTALGLAVLVPVLIAFDRATKNQPSPPDPLEGEDPSDLSRHFRWQLVPTPMKLFVALGAASLALIGLLS